MSRKAQLGERPYSSSLPADSSQARPSAFNVLFLGSATGAHTAQQLPFDDQRQPAASEQEWSASQAANAAEQQRPRLGQFGNLGRAALERGGGERLARRHSRGQPPRSVHTRQRDQIARRVHDGKAHGPALLLSFGFGRGNETLCQF